MQPSHYVLVLVLIAIAAYVYGRNRAAASERGGTVLHSRPAYHGAFFASVVALPALLIGAVWFAASPVIIQSLVIGGLPSDVQGISAADLSLSVSLIDKLADNLHLLTNADLDVLRQDGEQGMALLKQKGILMASVPEPFMVDAAVRKVSLISSAHWIITAVAAILVVGGFLYAQRRERATFRARNTVEKVMELGLIAASTVAVLTTIGIVASVLFESIHFFRSVSPIDFLLGTVWDPRFSAAGSGGTSGQFGLVPLLWGTLFITLVAMMVAVPVGLLAAIYMSEYATSKVRAVSKPVLEILAGIPTIVYGFFALTTVGPLLASAGGTVGLSVSPNSVLTAGAVMGIMIIPFVSSLSDDIISAVPNSLREGSYGLGATQSETIKRVILPAALPGIVGAVLLAVSRAIGETMIVVLAAGIAANLTINPLEPVTTITVKIVSQLTGDLEFNSPQTLVAFALGLTLFIVTLGLNVLALYIVRRYREQYE